MNARKPAGSVATFVLASVLISCFLSAAQSVGAGERYQAVFEYKGVKFGFRINTAKPTDHDWVLIEILNTNEYKVEVSFRLLTRSSADAWKLQGTTSITVKPLGRQAGELSGLWYVPFDTGDRVVAVQLREVNVNRIDRPWGAKVPHYSYEGIHVALRCGEYNPLARKYCWYVQMHNGYERAVHLDYGLHRLDGPGGTSSRIHIEPGNTYEQVYSSLLAVGPDEASRIRVDIQSVRVGEWDEGEYLMPVSESDER